MTFWKLIRRNLRFHARAHLGVVLGAAIGSAALIGALVVGDSVRESLTNMALRRLGKIHFALATQDRLFQTSLRPRLGHVWPPDSIPVRCHAPAYFDPYPRLAGSPRRWRFPASLPGRTAPRAPTASMCSGWMPSRGRAWPIGEDCPPAVGFQAPKGKGLTAMASR